MFSFSFHVRISQMQQQKEKLTAVLNDTVAEHLALEEEDSSLKLSLGNITSSQHQLDVRTSSEMDRIHFNQTLPPNYTTEVSLDGHLFAASHC